MKKESITIARKQIANIFESKSVKDFIMDDLTDTEVLGVIKETIVAIKNAKKGVIEESGSRKKPPVKKIKKTSK